MNNSDPGRPGPAAVIIDLLKTRFHRITPHELEKYVRRVLPDLSRQDYKAALKTLVRHGVLVYSTVFSITYLILAPDYVYEQIFHGAWMNAGNGIAANGFERLSMPDGMSFGAGDHPTTQLCLEALVCCVEAMRSKRPDQTIRALDVGTGSGILSIAAAKLGCYRVVALDLDIVACYEAKSAMVQNRLVDRISVFAGTIEALRSVGFELVMANLRIPTLKSIVTGLLTLVAPGGLMIISGFRAEEASTLDHVVSFVAGQKIQVWQDRGWAAMILSKPQIRPPIYQKTASLSDSI